MQHIVEHLQKYTHSKKQSGIFAAAIDRNAYHPRPFSEHQFQTLQEHEGMLAFIDGSNVELITTPALCVGMIRVAYAAFDGKKRIAGNMREHFVIIEAHGASKYHALLFPKIGSHDQFVIDAEDPDLREGKSRVVLSKGITLARDLAEIHLIVELGKVYPEWTYVRDGDLQAKHPLIQEVLERVYAEKISVAALAKTSDLLTDQGESLLDSVHERAPSGAWMYAPVNDTAPENHQAVIAVVKLQAASKYVFRFETAKTNSIPQEKIAGMLSVHARDWSFPGYPYGLILVHQRALISRRDAEYMRLKLFAHLPQLQNQARAKDAHDVLDLLV